MQTFLPYPDFAESARVLDRARLGKQRLECLQILRTLTGRSQAWKAHPAVLMWKDHEGWLNDYANAICTEWKRRGYVDHIQFQLLALKFECWKKGPHKPSWLGDLEFHRSHRSNLLRKAPSYYRKFWPNESDSMEYIWPV